MTERRTQNLWVGTAAAWVASALLLTACSGPPEPGQPIESATTIGGLGDTPGRFAFPRAIDVSADGRSLWVIDKSARVQKIDPTTGKCLALFHMPAMDLGKPTGFCIAPGRDEAGQWCDELLYIADTHYNRVMVYRPMPDAPASQRCFLASLATVSAPRPAGLWRHQ